MLATRVLGLFALCILIVFPAGFRYLDSQGLGHGTLNDESGLSEAELESLRKAQGWLEQMRQLKETEDQVSAAKRNILQAVTLALEEHDVQEEKIEEILHFTQMAMEKVLENYHGMPDWAMGSIGAQTGNLAALGWCVALPQSLPSSAFDLCILLL
nr:uncharacterized protein LOC106145805 [Columba livia]